MAIFYTKCHLDSRGIRYRYARGCSPQRCLPIRGSRVGPRLAPARIPRAAAALRSLRTATRRFLVAERGSVAIESALALTVLVSAFAGLMNIVGDVWADDRMGRGARAAARAIALNPSVDPWDVIKREGVLDANAACPGWTATANTCGGWTLRIDRGVAPAALPGDLAGECLVRERRRARAGATRARRLGRVRPRPQRAPGLTAMRMPWSGSLRAFVLEPRASAGLELGIGAAVLLGVAALCFDLYSRVEADTAASRVAATMADYVSRGPDTEGGALDRSALKKLGKFLRDHELDDADDMVIVISALYRIGARGEVRVVWSDTLHFGNRKVTRKLAPACSRFVQSAKKGQGAPGQAGQAPARQVHPGPRRGGRRRRALRPARAAWGRSPETSTATTCFRCALPSRRFRRRRDVTMGFRQDRNRRPRTRVHPRVH